ncbi:ATP-binding cassette domain-containing protein [Escherichia coli]|uniref:ATP-binding cassette domain-containing protein n=2 Tax=Escherichia coli TaxID=562 RepID=UPI001666EBAD|nr:ATP-binding cassette domain-containing protein [Escherichia coli]EET0039536.1 ATP-binding cassette domain-containing protein [Escherichia coli]EFF1744909.1 ATP-binding cassette domain-containing protein [Escherichia coli]EFF3149861.1 ATP-binding cassette domain-containing protein [Escherichia coli]EFF6479332.1 ATP-binding cassette domain-containing protein [Escherichia coli]EFJ6811575.1 ATP-binding cassette domain-containing protein [Escherichia coli]
MFANALVVYSKRMDIPLMDISSIPHQDILADIGKYIKHDFVSYRFECFVCRTHNELPDVFIVESVGGGFHVFERIQNDFCCLTSSEGGGEALFVGKKIIILMHEAKNFSADEVFSKIKSKIQKKNLLLIPMCTFSLLMPFYANIFNSRLVYSSSLTSVLYISIFFVFFVMIEKILRDLVYRASESQKHCDIIDLSKYLFLTSLISKDNIAPVTCRNIETSSVAYWKAVSTVIVDVTLAFMFYILMVIMLGIYSIPLTIYYIVFFIACCYIRFSSYKNALKSNKINSDRLTESFSFFARRKQAKFLQRGGIRNFVFERNRIYENLLLKLDMHNHNWGEILKLNTFLSMLIMYVCCYLSVSDGFLSIAAIIVVMIVNSRLSAAVIGCVNGLYNIKVNLYHVNTGIQKLMFNLNVNNINKCELDTISSFEFSNFTLSPYGRNILDSYSKKFSSGDVIAVAGKIGAGKSTLLKCLVSPVYDYTGMIFYNDIDVRKIKDDVYERLVAYYDLNSGFFSGTLRFNFNLYGVYSTERMIAIITQCCPGLNFDALLLDEGDASSLNLSEGEKQKLLITMMLEKRPSLIILDEPTSFMPTSESVAFIQRIIEENSNSIIFISSHDQNVKNICNHHINISQETIKRRVFIPTPKSIS